MNRMGKEIRCFYLIHIFITILPILPMLVYFLSVSHLCSIRVHLW